VDRSFVMVVRPTGSADATRYRLLESVRIYALEHLSNEERMLLRFRHLRWFSHNAQLADSHLHADEQIKWIRQLEGDWPNLVAAIEWADHSTTVDVRLLEGLRLVTAIAWFSRGRSSGNQVQVWLENLLNRAGDQEGPEWLAARANAHYHLGRYFWLKSNIGIAQRHHESSRALWSQLGQAEGQGYAFATCFLGYCLPVAETEQGMAYFREALALFHAAGNDWGEAEATFHMAVFQANHNDGAHAKPLYDQALALFRKTGDRQYQGLVNNNLFYYYINRAQFVEADQCCQEMQRCFSELNWIHGLNLTLKNRGILFIAPEILCPGRTNLPAVHTPG
jgi:hypothetical protein